LLKPNDYAFSFVHRILVCSTFSFYLRDAMLARVIAIATCLSVRPSVSHEPVLCQNEDHDFFTIW